MRHYALLDALRTRGVRMAFIVDDNLIGNKKAMVDANIASVFVGIESPNEASLRETKTLQNVRAGASRSGRAARKDVARRRSLLSIDHR
jgi:hypothetical protein